MKNGIPTPHEARAALAEALSRSGQVRRSDNQFRPILLGLAAIYLAAGGLVGLFPRGGSRFAGIALIVIFVAGLAAGVALIWRIRAYSRSGILRFSVSCAAFSIWNGAVMGLSSGTGWWGYHQPGIHFTASVVVAAIPLLVAEWLVSWKRP